MPMIHGNTSTTETSALLEVDACAPPSIEDLKRLQEALREKDAHILQQQKMDAVGSLAGGVAHEFNNLLQAIRGYTCFARDALEQDSEPYHDLEKVIFATDRAAVLTRQLLDFSRTDTTEPRQCDANEIVEALDSLLRPLIPATIEMHIKLDSQNPQLLADPQLMQQVLLNLCINARDAMPDGGTLTVRTERVHISESESEGHAELLPSRYVRFLVTDTGEGIPQEVQDRIFEPFFTTKEVGSGTGLGLAMAYGVVQQSGGLLSFHTEKNHGTTFRIYLPLSEEDDMNQVDHKQETIKQETKFRSELQGSGELILLAEDDMLVSEVGRRMLLRAGYEVLTAADGEEALEMFVANADQLGLLLMDVCMPKLTGREVLEHIRRLHSPVPICFCTGYDPEASQSKTLQEMGCHVIEKPFDEKRLLTAVKEAIGCQLSAIGKNSA